MKRALGAAQVRREWASAWRAAETAAEVSRLAPLKKTFRTTAVIEARRIPDSAGAWLECCLQGHRPARAAPRDQGAVSPGARVKPSASSSAGERSSSATSGWRASTARRRSYEVGGPASCWRRSRPWRRSVVLRRSVPVEGGIVGSLMSIPMRLRKPGIDRHMQSMACRQVRGGRRGRAVVPCRKPSMRWARAVCKHWIARAPDRLARAAPERAGYASRSLSVRATTLVARRRSSSSRRSSARLACDSSTVRGPAP